jgi:hypothetical protein
LVSRVTSIDDGRWTDALATAPRLAEVLEAGDVILFPRLAFDVTRDELRLFSPDLIAAAKNVSFDPRTNHLGGTSIDGANRMVLGNLLSRFSRTAATFVRARLTAYADRIEVARASFRPVEIAGRASSWRKDDTRLHIDSFPATPVGGRRILRVFTNVNPHGRARSWRIGEDFESVARRFAGLLRMPLPGAAVVLRLLHVTKSRRSRYDALMLQLHDRMKADTAYQSSVPQTTVDFAPGSTWMAFTDQVSHAATAGQYQLEQTFLIPVEAMLDQNRAPLRVLERIIGRRLV